MDTSFSIDIGRQFALRESQGAAQVRKMNWNDFETAFSAPRVGRYKSKCAGNEAHAMIAYRYNLLITESLAPFFCTVEIALRNAMHKQLTAYFGRQNWWTTWAGNPAYRGQVESAVSIQTLGSARLRSIKASFPQSGPSFTASR